MVTLPTNEPASARTIHSTSTSQPLRSGSNVRTVRVAAVGDVHCGKDSAGTLQGPFGQIADTSDILLLCGDQVNYGLPEEANVLAKELTPVTRRIPILAVQGNHEYESGKADEVKAILEQAGVVFLDGEAREIHGIGFAGVKGFMGGFGRCLLQSWGESAVKAFVQESMQEALKLETALAMLRTSIRIAVLHYSPIQGTVEGEPAEIFPYLGSGRLEEPINRYAVSAVFHGHAHRGTAEGRTMNQTPVYNVALPLLQRAYPDRPSFRLMELKVDEEGGAS
ncbi:MAG: metallophosphoesterase [Verrucomicrobiae bacterium]|nr:metallophosphoesterase [Verrucomicrobiae bacterium]